MGANGTPTAINVMSSGSSSVDLRPDECLWARRASVLSVAACLFWTALTASGASGSAPTTNHWSFEPIRAATIPDASKSRATIANEIDGFIHTKLAAHGLELSRPADRVTLIRRLTFDLTGLPPSPAEVEQFSQDPSPNAYHTLVERLLASPHYGERWARHWLDVVRYTESQGFEYDKLRDNAWHYRDYVVRSFNSDKSYQQFMREQVAGDVLEPVTTDGIVGASLLICGPWDEAGNAQANATQRMITREDELEDTIGVVGQTFLGLTVNCARCHSHKFDPISLDEYYRIKSVFDGVKHGERGIAGSEEIARRDARIQSLRQALSTAREETARLERLGRSRAAAGRKEVPEAPGPTPYAHWSFDRPGTHALPGSTHGSARIENGRLVLPQDGAYYQSVPLTKDIREKTLEAWVSLADLKQGGGAAISLESADGHNFDAIVFGERQPRKWMAGSSGFERTRDLDAPEETATAEEVVQVAIVYRADNSIALFRNGEAYGKPYSAGTLQTFTAGSARILLGMRHTGGGRPWLTGQIRRASLYDRALSPDDVAASYRARGLAIPQAEVLANLTADEREAHDTSLAQARRIQSELDAIPPVPVSYAGTRVQPKPTQRLRRGDVKTPEAVVAPGALSALRQLSAEFDLAPDAPEAQRRLKFADWLADPRNPLPARVMANRVWHFHFGQGLVSTPNDFGASGARPTHPELLDWLADRFIASGWSIKALHRLIVTSDTYRQSSIMNEKAAALDADDQWLWRFPPRRLEAEAVRDAMLAISGQLNRTMGGPSYRPFDILKFPANAYVPVDKVGPEFHRRSIYRMNVNSGKEPLMDAFDCPDPAVKTPRRGVTTTPLQALGLMNNAFVQRMARHLAESARRTAGGEDSKAIQTAYQLALGRPPNPSELERALPASRQRGLESICWALLNSTEFVYVR